MAHLAKLSSSRVNLQRVREEAFEALLGLVSVAGGKTALVVDADCGSSLTHVAGAQALKDHGVAELHRLGFSFPSHTVEAVVLLARPRLELCNAIAQLVRESPRHARIIAAFVPHRATSIERSLERKGALSSLELSDLALDLVPLEADVVSLESPRLFKEAHLDGDPGPLRSTARSLDRLQKLSGTVPLVRGKGQAARSVATMVTSLRKEREGPKRRRGAPAIDMILLLDRQIDLVTPMCTQLTYEGLVDEVLGITSGSVDVPEDDDDSDMHSTASSSESGSQLLPNQDASRKKHHRRAHLNSTDELFAHVRDLGFGKACELLRERSSELQASYRNVKSASVEEQDVSDLRAFVRSLKANVGAGVDLHATIAKHLLDKSRGRRFMRKLELERMCVECSNADEVCEAIEEMAGRQEPLPEVLRLLSLLSLTHGGIPRRHADTLRREVMLAYGCEHTLTLGHLDRLGILSRPSSGASSAALGTGASAGGASGMSTASASSSGNAAAATTGAAAAAAVVNPVHILSYGRSAFATFSRSLNLVMDEPSEDDPSYAYPHSGYSPLSIRLVERAIAPLHKHHEQHPQGEQQHQHQHHQSGAAGWADDAVRAVPGVQFGFTQAVDADGNPYEGAFNAGRLEKRPDGRKPLVLVSFIGGMTRAEISALRQLQQSGRAKCDFLSAPTGLIKGTTLLGQVLEDHSALSREEDERE